MPLKNVLFGEEVRLYRISQNSAVFEVNSRIK